MKRGIPNVRHLLGVVSGKGGVGKSTTAVNLAMSMAASGLAVGLLDADIYGPSIPSLMNLKGHSPDVTHHKKLVPPQNYGVPCMSSGFLQPDLEAPIIWRGPMVSSALRQMSYSTDWPSLDVLLVDFPPGTGDVHLTATQTLPFSGVVVVSTPQDLAIISAVKGLNMFRKVDVPVLGVIENMSYFKCPSCSEKHYIFGEGGAKRRAKELDVPLLGELPLLTAIRENADLGTPIVHRDPTSEAALAYKSIAEKVWKKIDKQ